MKCATNLIKHVNFQNVVRLRPNHENSAYFTRFALKSLNFAQILENFALACIFASSVFRSSEVLGFQ